MAINTERGADQSAFDRALEHFTRSHEPVVVVAESADGSAGPLLEGLPVGVGPVVRATAARATRAKVGCLSDELGLDDLTSGVVVVEDAQWADPTSLGRLQRMVKSPAPPELLLLIAYRPISGEDLYGIEQLAETAERHAVLFRTRVEQADAALPPEVTNPSARDLVLATSLVLQSISVDVAARLLDVSEAEVLDIAEPLVASGLLNETRSGFGATASATLLDAGEARLGHMAGRLATVLEDSGGDSAVVGNLRLASGEPARAYPLLLDASRTASARSAAGEAFHLAEAALQAAADGAVGTDADLGELHLICGRHLRAAGRSSEAAAHLDRATSLLVGPTRIDALGFAAAVADDRQRPQESERILAMAEWEAATQGERAKLGSLGTFHARSLNRLGFAAEADALLAKSEGLLDEEAAPAQRANAQLNRAWILFDRGQVGRAETEFTHLRDSTHPDDHSSLADKEAWRARALFASGRPDEALAAVSAARDLAEKGEVEAPLFLTHLALTEGNLLYGRPADALAAADRVLDLVERQLTAWENVARADRSVALLRLGESDRAREEIAAAIAATPAGADGWRWRSRCQAIEIEIAAHSGSGWRQREAEDLADMLLQAQYYGWAADLMCVIAEQSNDPEVAREALALALQVGNPMMAVRAAHAGRLWKDPAAAPVIRAVRSMADRMPEEWEEEWRLVPGVEEALTAPEPAEDDTGAENAAVLEQALRRAGLAGADVILSPAQRRSRGLVRRRPRRRWTPVQVAAAALGVVAVAALTSVGVAQLVDSPPDVTIVTQVVEDSPATTAPLTLEETELSVPGDFLFGEVPFRGGPARTGVVEVAGPRQVDGMYWEYETTGPIIATPVAYGRNLIVASTDGLLYALDLTSGRRAWTLQTDGRISASPEVATVATGEGQRPALAIVAGEDGVVRARDAVLENTSQAWQSSQLGERITSAPVAAEEMVMVATSDGYVHALSLLGGDEVWRYPAEGEGIGPISAPLAYADGVVYAATQGGNLHLLDVATGTPVCPPVDFGADTVASPVIADGAVFVPSRGNTVFVLPAGQCSGTVAGRLPLYVTDAPIEVAPAIRGDRMYITSGPFLYSIDLTDNSDAWPPSTVDADSVISAAPVVANDTVYFGTEDGSVHAVDAEDGEELWTWRTGNIVRASPVVIDGAVYIASGDGSVYAVGESP
ncbi:MAG TPA: PQQ-binding-like beta-propeller repeat protein [Acidimicrobiia bacterium]|nr:PQQ-binding-like beta-propeller repeat protein [Acidimicrobiia bacterium]